MFDIASKLYYASFILKKCACIDTVNITGC